MLLEYVNAAGRSVRFAAPDGWTETPYLLTGVAGAHGLDAQIQSVEQFPRDGEIYVGSRVEPRVITLEGFIHDANNKTASHRVPLLEAMRPKEIGTLTASRGAFKRRIRCVIERAPWFTTPSGKKFSVMLRCSDPYWSDASDDTTHQMNGWVGLFEFELAIPDAADLTNADDPYDIDGVELGTRGNTSLAIVTNAGDVASGFTATLTAIGPVVDPELLKVSTQERALFHVELASGDKLTLSTSEFDKWALITRADGTVENAMRYIDPTFAFFALEPGDTVLRAGAAQGGALLSAVVDFRPRYLGL